MKERRRYPRKPVSWPVRVWLGVDVFTLARAVNASTRGIRITASEQARPFLRVGEPYRLEIAADPESEIAHTGEIRNIGDSGVGFELRADLAVPESQPSRTIGVRGEGRHALAPIQKRFVPDSLLRKVRALLDASGRA